MRGVVFKGDRDIQILDFNDPTPGPDEVVIAIRASGMCGSDLKYYREGMYNTLKSNGFADPSLFGFDPQEPMIAGHEPCGEIVALGSNVDPRAFKVGDRVMVFHYSGCSYCDQCRSGWTQMCRHGAQVFGQGNGHGGHADYMRAPAASLVHMPDEISFSAGAAISCGTGTAYQALRRMNLDARATIAIFGLGPVGLSAVLFAKAFGARIWAFDISPERLAQAKAFGADEAINSREQDPVAAIMERTCGRGVPYALECSGAAQAQQAAVKGIARWGTLGMVGVGGQLTLDVTKDVILKQLTLLGSLTFSILGLDECARFVAQHGIDIDALYTDRWTIDQAAIAYQKFDRGEGLKGVIAFG